MYHFLQKLIRLLRPSQANGNLVQRVPLSFFPFLRNLQNRKRPKGPPFNFFGIVRNFFLKFLRSQKSPPSSFLIFCNRMYVNESQRVPPFHFSALCDIFEVFFKKFFKKIFKFCSQSGNSDFPVISSMKGTLWVSRKCFQSFS